VNHPGGGVDSGEVKLELKRKTHGPGDKIVWTFRVQTCDSV
jgi:hypothetical protein